ncbi:non-ribosomal peptide synthetase [Paenibacillus xylanexedens]|uniref:non-ribosomal peptide synthetase n=1 Tax=Paenibacillus xylanexedens TaxID=528191 RepID=UPI00119CEED0|nr:non-ribosomal peptide synthetase [Paenibacillus xylanexedens]
MKNKDVVDIYPLSPIQQGMLFHSLYDQGIQANDTYLTQINLEVEGSLNLGMMEEAWNILIERHSVFRTRFLWNSTAEPLQAVYRQARITLERHDWQALETSDREAALARFLTEDQERGIDLKKVPLMRVSLIQWEEERYNMVWMCHHLLFDGWSFSVVQAELLHIYQSLVRGQHMQLPEVRPYRDFIHWLRNQDAGAAETFWKQELRGFDSPTQLGMKLGGSAEEETSSAQHDLTIPEEYTAAIKKLATESRITVNTVLQGAWALTLSRYSQESDVLFGVTSSGRGAELEGAEHMVGLFINTLPLRIQVDGEQVVREWLQSVHRRQSTIRQYEHTSLVDIRNWSPVPQDQPLFETLFVFENYPTPIDDQPGEELVRITEIKAAEKTNFPITVSLSPAESELHMKVMYKSDRFDAEWIERLSGHFMELLRQMAATPDRSLAQLGMVTAAERQQLLVDWNETDQAYNWSCLVHQLVEEQAAKAPEALAATDADRQITYGELNERANVLAHTLRKRGACPGSYVGVCTERSVDWLVGMLGVFKSGACYVPLDPTYPEERLAYMMADANVLLLVTHSQVLTQLTVEPSVEVLCLDQESEWGTWSSVENGEISEISEYRANPEPWATAQDPAYVIYTSGSTGQPKGAILRHQGLLNVVLWHQGRFGTSPADRGAQIARMGFDASLLETWPLLCSGGSVHLMEQEIVLNPEGLQHWLLDHQITLSCFLPPVVAEQLLPLTWPQDGALRALLAGGERLQMRPPAHLTFDYVNIYGPTECTILSTVSTVEAEDGSFNPPSIGGALPNTQLYVLDAHQNPVPRGVPGELYIGGVGVAIGYLNREELNAEKFVAHPFRSGERLYRTGDLVKYNADATLSYIGRADHQVKIRGFRIELGEIESVLVGHPAVHSVIVQAREIGETGKQLVAYIATQPESSRGKATAVLVNELREYMKPKLPQFMLPAAWVVLDRFPVTPNGKVDRKALPEPTPSELYGAQDYVAPRHPVEEMLAGIWSDVLGLQRIGAHDHFFELGGHSLLATQIVSRVKKLFGIEYPLAQVFQRPVLSQMAKRIQELRSTEGGQDVAATSSMVDVTREQNVPLSFAQQRMWFFEQMYPGNRNYHIPSLWRLNGSVQREVLERSIHDLIQRHESLRTYFLSGEGNEPLQVVLPEIPSVLTYMDLQNHPDALQQAMNWITDEGDREFSLRQGPLLRAALIQLAPQEYVLGVTMHHIISDGWSMGVFIRELSALYTAHLLGEAAPLAELPIQYADYAIWQRKWLGEGVMDRQLDYWKQQLQDVSILQLPTDYPRPAAQTFEGATERFHIAEPLLAELKKLSRREGTTLYMTLLSAWKILLHRYTQQEDIAVGTPIANRNHEETEGLIGFFANTLVLRSQFAGNMSFRQLLTQVKETALQAYMHQDVPFEKLVEELQPDRDTSHTPLFQVLFTLQNTPADEFSIPDVHVHSIELQGNTALFDLSLIMEEKEQGLGGDLIYNTALFAGAGMKRLVQHFHILLEGIVANPDQAMNELPLLSKEEQHQLIVEWNQNRRDYSWERCVHELFEAQAATAPDALAVSDGDERLRYGELNHKANQLAHELRNRGARRGMNVGVCMERSTDWLIAMIAVFKSGACYVPLDPTYPEDRLRFIMEDAQVGILITGKTLMHQPSATVSEVIYVDQSEPWMQGNHGNPVPASTADDIAYIIYTSGSTGKPKGAMLKHKGLLNVIFWHHERFGITPADRSAQVSRMGFDASLLEVWPFLTAGASVHLMEQEVVMDAQVLQQWFLSKGITIGCFLPPVIAEQLLDLTWPQDGVFRSIMVGGDRLQLRPPADLPFEYINIYGPTECTIFSTEGRVASRETNNQAPSIGWALPNITLYVLDPQLHPVPIGVPGELYIGGVGVAAGYLNREALTAEKFIPHPFQVGERLYRTGDLVKLNEDASLEFVSRVDHQVQLRGFRIELGEIESVISSHPSVQAALVLVKETKQHGSQLVAYLTGRDTQVPVIEDIREHVKRKLPHFMIPSAWVVMDEFPLTPNRKLDRKALPDPVGDEAYGVKEYVAPQSPLEQVIAEIWTEVLGVSRVGIHDDFFALGGHSLLAVQMISRLNARQGTDAKLADLFVQPILQAFAGKVEQQPPASSTLTPIKRISRKAQTVQP